MSESRFPCPVCGYLVFDRPPGSYELCPVCQWGDDAVQLRFPLAGGANEPLVQYQRRFLAGWDASRAPSGLERCPDWRPLNQGDFERTGQGPVTGLEYFEAVDSQEPSYYWRLPPRS